MSTWSYKTWLIGAGVVLMIVGLIYVAVRARQEFTRECEAMGGHVKDSHSTSYGYHTGTDGKQVYGSYQTTTTYCIGNNGEGILDVQ